MQLYFTIERHILEPPIFLSFNKSASAASFSTLVHPCKQLSHSSCLSQCDGKCSRRMMWWICITACVSVSGVHMKGSHSFTSYSAHSCVASVHFHGNRKTVFEMCRVHAIQSRPLFDWFLCVFFPAVSVLMCVPFKQGEHLRIPSNTCCPQCASSSQGSCQHEGLIYGVSNNERGSFSFPIQPLQRSKGF